MGSRAHDELNPGTKACDRRDFGGHAAVGIHDLVMILRAIANCGDYFLKIVETRCRARDRQSHLVRRGRFVLLLVSEIGEKLVGLARDTRRSLSTKVRQW